MGLRLFLYTGARGIEAHRADIEDLKTVGEDLVLYVQRKGSADIDEMDKVIIAHPDARAAIYDYLAARGASSGPLFVTDREYDSLPRRSSRQTLRLIVRKALNRAGVTTHDKSNHSLRHTAASNALINNADVGASKRCWATSARKRRRFIFTKRTAGRTPPNGSSITRRRRTNHMPDDYATQELSVSVASMSISIPALRVF
ncbi:MAG: tyrosine-type recombinase/integrase [Chloracidobacterium sp.]|nr:tyrosine-type recombinase/integrase [Chloracidobacterium sp.]